MKQIFIYYDNTVKPQEHLLPITEEVVSINDGIQYCVKIAKNTGVSPVGFTFIDTDDASKTQSIWFNGKIMVVKNKEYIIIGDDFGTPKEENDTIFKIQI